MSQLILASQSPRRQELLRKADIKFKVRALATNEIFPKGMPVRKAPEYIAGTKAQALWKDLPVMEQFQTVVLAADTVVIFEDQILGKPNDEEMAKRDLERLSGEVHEVVTGVCIIGDQKQVHFSNTTKVFFRPLTKDQINYYVHQYRPFDKAGAYGIQEWIGLVGIEKIEGDYYNVMGLPIGDVVENLKTNFPKVFEG